MFYKIGFGVMFVTTLALFGLQYEAIGNMHSAYGNVVKVQKEEIDGLKKEKEALMASLVNNEARRVELERRVSMYQDTLHVVEDRRRLCEDTPKTLSEKAIALQTAVKESSTAWLSRLWK